MAIGAGKYDSECVDVLQATQAYAVVLIVVHGNRGDGISIDIRPELAMTIYPMVPDLLRKLADEVERSLSDNQD